MNKLAITLALAVFGTLAAVAIIGAPKSSTLADSDLQSLYSQWKVQYNQVYGGPEDKMRYHVFASNYHIVEAHNAKNTTWTLGLNQFAALTHDEFSAIYLGYKAAAPAAPATNDNTYTATGASVDWRTKGAVNPVKNQGQCGSCWAFSTVASVESAIFIATGKLPDLSEQQLVDCSGSEGNQGCNGGLPDQGFEYVQKTGLAGEDAYPYTATDGKCKEKTQKILAKISGYKDVAANVNAIKTAVTQQPVSIAIEADQSAFQLYNGGVISSGCGTELDHAVQIVGFAEPGSAGFQADAKDTPYWIVRNSWGASWGEQGYVRIAMGTQNNGAGECGINQQVSYPVV